MKIEFVGAARTVTGSSYIVKCEKYTIMIDCGMFQGRRELRDRNYLSLIYAPEEIDALLVTHAHIDHSGLIPKLVKDGFKSNIYCTRATSDLLTVMLPDSAHIQEMDAEWISRRNKKLGREPVEPLYTQDDADDSLKHLKPQTYREKFQVIPGVEARFSDAGHILGSAILELWATDDDGSVKKIVFSGDLGPKDQAIIKDREEIKDADYLLVESTYGNRLHKSRPDTYNEFKDIINNAYNRKGNIIIPSFAVERTQEIIYTLAKLFRSGEIPRIPVYIDSPLAIAATEIFRKHPECYDDETRALIEKGENPLDFPNLHFTKTTDESKELNAKARGAIIISASGMCTAGRIKFHLQNNLWKKDSSVIFVGYQAEGTLGRSLVDGATRVRVYGEDVVVNATIHTLGGFSGHADRDSILQWVGAFTNKDMKVFVIHGEEESSIALSKNITEKFGYHTHVPRWGEVVDLDTMKIYYEDYGHGEVDVALEIENEMNSLKDNIESIINKYRLVRQRGNIREIQHARHDLEDLKELMNIIENDL